MDFKYEVEVKKFKDIDLNDNFFDSLKADYNEQKFTEWFLKKDEETCTVIFNESGNVAGFLYLKEENEELKLINENLGAKSRLKLGTFKLADEVKGTKCGEKFISIALHTMVEKQVEEAYVTIFEKQVELIGMLNAFGFVKVGAFSNGEQVLIRKNECNFYNTNPKLNYPYINMKSGLNGRYLLIEEEYHDKFFPQAKLKGVSYQDTQKIVAGNGASKIYISRGYNLENIYKKGSPLLIYRKANSNPGFKSAVSSIGVCEKCIKIKENNNYIRDFEEYMQIIGNKSIFTDEMLKEIYYSEKNVYAIKFIFNFSFGEGNNVNCSTLRNAGYFGDGYPTSYSFTKPDIEEIIKLGGSNVQNFIID